MLNELCLAPGYVPEEDVEGLSRGPYRSWTLFLLHSRYVGTPFQIDVLHWMSRTALKLIGQSGLGYTFDSLAESSQENTYTRGVRRFK